MSWDSPEKKEPSDTAAPIEWLPLEENICFSVLNTEGGQQQWEVIGATPEDQHYIVRQILPSYRRGPPVLIESTALVQMISQQYNELSLLPLNETAESQLIKLDKELIMGAKLPYLCTTQSDGAHGN